MGNNETDIILSDLKKVLEGIKSGISLQNGEIRKFDILDFHQVCNIDITKKFGVIRDNVSISEFRELKKFIANNPLGTKLDDVFIRRMFTTKYELNTLRDENNMPIPGTGREITNEEKKIIFDYIVDNNLPLYTKIFFIACQRYANGELLLENKKEELKKYNKI